MRTSLTILPAILVLLIMGIFPVMAQEGPDEREPNNSRNEADEIDSFNLEGEVGGKGDDHDWFRLTGQEGQYAIFTIRHDDEDCDIDFEVWSQDDLVGTAVSAMSPDRLVCALPERCYIHVFPWDGSGEYQIDIEPIDEYEFDIQTQDYSDGLSNCEGPDEFEPNDSRELADRIAGFEIAGVACEGEDDWFVLDGQESGYPIFYLYYDTEFCDIDMEIYSDDSSVGLLNDTASPDIGEFDVPGTCYLRVYSIEGKGDYLIDIDPSSRDWLGRLSVCEGPDEIEPNGNRDQVNFIDNYLITGYACEDDVDWYILDGQEGVNPLITLRYDSDECDVDLEIWDDDNRVGSLESMDSPDSDTFRIRGECRIKVYSFHGEGEYTIEIEP